MDVKTTCERLLEGVPDDAMILVHKVDVIRLTTSPVSEANGFDIRRAAMARMRLDLAASTQDAPTEVGETMIPLADAVRGVEEFFWPDDRTGQRAIAALQALGGGDV